MRASIRPAATARLIVAVTVLLALASQSVRGEGVQVAPELASAIAHLAAETGGRDTAAEDVLAVHLTPAGHWQLANRAGEVVTAAGVEEVRRALRTLRRSDAADTAPGARAPHAPGLLLTEEAATRGAALVEQLPATATLRVLTAKSPVRLVRVAAAGKSERLMVQMRPYLLLETSEPASLRETLWQLDRPLDPSAVRLLALEPGASRTLSPQPRREAGSRVLAPDVVDPYALTKAMPALRGQKILIVGRLDRNLLWFQARSGSEQSLLVEDVRKAAVATDVSLVILDTRLPRQPGERTWAYLKVTIPGLDEAMKAPTVGDFYNALAAAHGRMVLRLRTQSADRVRLEARPLDATWGGAGTGAGRVPGAPGEGREADSRPQRSVGAILQDLVTGVTGNVAADGVDMDLRSKRRQLELDSRWLPWLPASLQVSYVLLLSLGLAAWPTASAWWRRLWPPESRSEYRGRLGYVSACVVRWLAFVLVFAPAVAVAAFPWQVARGLADTTRLVLTGRRAGTTTPARPVPPPSPSRPA